MRIYAIIISILIFWSSWVFAGKEDIIVIINGEEKILPLKDAIIANLGNDSFELEAKAHELYLKQKVEACKLAAVFELTALLQKEALLQSWFLRHCEPQKVEGFLKDMSYASDLFQDLLKIHRCPIGA